MNFTYLRREHTIPGQLVAPSPVKANHGSTKKRTPTAARSLVSAAFPNLYEVVDMLPIPGQEEISADGTTFVWCPFELAVSVAGPLTRRVLEAIRAGFVGNKRYIYVDSKDPASGAR